MTKKRFFILIFVILFFSSCSSPTKIINTQASTTTPEPTQTKTPSQTPTQPSTQPTAFTCNDKDPGDLTTLGNPSSGRAAHDNNINAYPFGLRNYFNHYDPNEVETAQREIHGRIITVGVQKDMPKRLAFRKNAFTADYFIRSYLESDEIYTTWSIYWKEFGGFPFNEYTVLYTDCLSDVQIGLGWGEGVDFWFCCFGKYLLSHEIYHAWNGFAFQPPLWFQEGVTNYYAFRNSESYSSYVSSMREANQVRGQDDVVLSDLQPHNPDYFGTNNFMEVNYEYVKGPLVAYLLDLELAKIGHHLGEVMRLIYQRYGAVSTQKVSNQQILSAVNEVSGKDFTDFFNKYIYGKEPLPLDGKHFDWVCHEDGAVQVISFDPKQNNPQPAIFNIDGFDNDWADVKPVNIEGEVISSDPREPLKEYLPPNIVFFYQFADNYYFMVDLSKRDLRDNQLTLPIYLDYGKDRRAYTSLWVAPGGFFQIQPYFSFPGFDPVNPNYEEFVKYEWKDVLEIMIPIDVIGSPKEIHFYQPSMYDASSSWYEEIDFSGPISVVTESGLENVVLSRAIRTTEGFLILKVERPEEFWDKSEMTIYFNSYFPDHRKELCFWINIDKRTSDCSKDKTEGVEFWGVWDNSIYLTIPLDAIGNPTGYSDFRIEFRDSKPEPSPLLPLPPLPPSSLSFTIDGYKADWQGLTVIHDPSGDSLSNNTDIIGYSYAHDENYLDIMLETRDPIIINNATLEIGLILKNTKGTRNYNYSLNVMSDGEVWGGNDPITWDPLPSIFSAWKDVVEIEIPRNVFRDYIIVGVDYFTLWANVNGEFQNVDMIQELFLLQ